MSLKECKSPSTYSEYDVGTNSKTAVTVLDYTQGRKPRSKVLAVRAHLFTLVP